MLLNFWKYRIPTQIVFGKGVFRFLPDLLRERQWGRRVTLVTSKGSMKRLGYLDRAEKALTCSNFSVEVYAVSLEYSDFEAVHEITDYVRRNRADIIIGMGGGTFLDLAKAAAFFQNNSWKLEEGLRNTSALALDRPRLVEVPTTAGTGGEVTQWAVLWNLQQKKKYSLSHPSLYPDLALVDPELALHLPPKLTAITGMDVFTHAVEAYWSKNHQPVSDLFALEAVRLVKENLELAYRDPNDMAAREGMARGSLLAGLAFSNTQTTAAHAMSYPLTTHFGVPHGLASSISVPELMKENAETVPERVGDIARALGQSDVDGAASFIQGMARSIGLPTRLRELGLSLADLDLCAGESFYTERMGNNPKALVFEDVRRILGRIY
jgi:alcohol dehydrogenase class IV